MGKQPTSSTEKIIPDWLLSSLKPLLSQSAGNLNQFAAQGQNVLQGRPAGEAAPIGPGGAPQGPGLRPRGGVSPGVLAAMKARVR